VGSATTTPCSWGAGAGLGGKEGTGTQARVEGVVWSVAVLVSTVGERESTVTSWETENI